MIVRAIPNEPDLDGAEDAPPGLGYRIPPEEWQGAVTRGEPLRVRAWLESDPSTDLAEPIQEIEPADDGDELDEWRRVDLGPALRGELPEITPDVGHRDDGRALLYRKHVNGEHADSGVGKGWVAAVFAVQELAAGHHVAWVSFEDPDERLVVSRLLELGATTAEIFDQLHYFAPTSTPFTVEAVDQVVAEITRHEITLVVIDSLGEAFGLEGIDENADKEVGPWMRRVARTLADAGPAVLLIDHSTKSTDNPLHPSGSKRKRAAITGASYLIEAPKPLTKGAGGRLRLTCAKDRHGHYRRGDIAAEIEFTVYPDGGMTVHVWPPTTAERSGPASQLRAVARAAVRALRDADEPLSERRLLERMNVKARHELKKAAIEEAIADGAIRLEAGPRGAKAHIYVRDLTDPTEAES